MKQLILIRHGENDVMRTRLAGRQPGVHLNERGRAQAASLVRAVGDVPVKAIFSSPLERAVETAQPLAAALGLPIRVLDGLNEVDYGDWMGKTFKQLARTHLWKQLHDAASSVRFPGGETLAEAQNRALTALDFALGTIQDGESVVCVSHADVVRLAGAYYLNMALDDYHRLCVDPASQTIIQCAEGQIPRVLRINQVLPLPTE